MLKNVYSLSQLTRSIRNVIDLHCSRKVWIKAEIVKLNHYSKTGHCYPSLVEKKQDKVVAELKGTIWNSEFQVINRKFREVVGAPLNDDMSVVFLGQVSFHPVHGLSVNILDVDPEFTLGQLAREKAETLAQLREKGIFENNKKIALPRLPKTIAVISVESSKGYQDFLEVLQHSKYRFHHLLFPAILQGERATTTIGVQLEKIKAHTAVFDAVAIIRGGGGEVGLSCFDNYNLAEKICTFPIPVLTGIGHSTNQTVCEIVSHSTCITPTKTAEFLVQKFSDFEAGLVQAQYQIQKESGWMCTQEKQRIRETARLFHSLVLRVLDKNRADLQKLSERFRSKSQDALEDQKRTITKLEQSLISTATDQLKTTSRNLQFIQEKLHLLSPESTLKRGYSISRQKGKIIKDVKAIDPDEILETELFEGTLYSRITRTQEKKENERKPKL